jgi:hypothetical protein
MSWEANIAGIGKMRSACNPLDKNHKGRDHMEDFGIDEITILKWKLKKYGVCVWTGFIRLRMGSSGRLL